MRSRTLRLNFMAVTLGILLAVISRLLPHPANFAPMMAVGIFGGALFIKRVWAFIIPVGAIWLSDLVLNNVVFGQYFDHFVWLYDGWYWQYAVYILVPGLSLLLFKKRITALKIAGLSISSAVLFFLISNFGVWAGSGLYPPTPDGLLSCYAMGLPFFKGTLLSNLVYTSVLFGAYYLLENKTRLFPQDNQHQWQWV